MFLEQFLIGNLWNAGLICVMLALKWLLRNRLSLRFQYYSWYVLLGSLLLSLLPSGIWPEFRSAESVGQQAFAISNAASNTANVAITGTGWIQDTTELIVSSENGQFAFIAMMIWLVGVLVLIGVYWCGSWRLRLIKQFATEPSYKIRERFDECRRRLGQNQNVELRQSRFITAPVSFGWKRAFVVLPKDGIDGLPAAELDHVLLHELTHIKHRDLITNYLFCGIQALYWCNPLIWLAFRQMRRDREAYCDWSVMNELTDEAERIRYVPTNGDYIQEVTVNFDEHGYSESFYAEFEELCFYTLKAFFPDMDDDEIVALYEEANYLGNLNVFLKEDGYEKGCLPCVIYHKDGIGIYPYFAIGEWVHLCIIPVTQEIIDDYEQKGVEIREFK